MQSDEVTIHSFSSTTAASLNALLLQYGPRCEKTGLRGFRSGRTQTGAVQSKKMASGLKFRI